MISVATALALGVRGATTNVPATAIATDQFKVDLFNGGHSFLTSGGLAYKALLIKASPTGVYNKTLTNVGTPGSGSPTTSNVGTDEASGAGYTSGGFALTNISAVLSSDTAVVNFVSNPSWGASATLSVSAMVVYTTDSTKGAAGRTVAVYLFGGPQTVTANTLTVTLPAAGAIRST